MNSIPMTATTRSDGTGTLSHALTVAVYDYVRHFGREPKLIQIPFWRGAEMGEEFLDYAAREPEPKFHGVPFRFSIISDAIELSRIP